MRVRSGLRVCWRECLRVSVCVRVGMEAHRPNKKRTEEKGEKEQTGGKTKRGFSRR